VNPGVARLRRCRKNPQAAYPHADLVETNRRRTGNDMEYELLDTGVFDEDRYFDVFVEYAKAGPEDILVIAEGRPAGRRDNVVPAHHRSIRSTRAHG
jgi:hypothetical protein